MTAPGAVRFEALSVFELALVEHIRTAMTAHYVGTWLQQLQSVFGDRWIRLRDLARQSQANTLEPPAQDEFAYLGIAQFPELFDKQFAVLAPKHISKAVLLRELNKIRDERNSNVHARGGDPTKADAVELMNVMRHVLRALDQKEGMHKIDDLMDAALGLPRDTPTPVAGSEAGTPTVEMFYRMWDTSEPEILIAPLMHFFQSVADDLYSGSEDSQYPMEERWGWHRGAERVALALQDILANGLTQAGYDRLLSNALQGLDEEPPPPQ